MSDTTHVEQAVPSSPSASQVTIFPNAYGRMEQIGATITKHQSMVSPYTINVKDFGAKGDDSTDDTAAIKAARDYGVANYATWGYTLYFPEGRYRISSVLAFASDYLNIRGAGRGSSQIWTTAGFTTGDVITFGAQSQITIKDISLWSNENRTTGSGIAFAGTSSVIVDSMFVWNQFIGFNLTSTAQLIHVTNVTIDAPNNDSYGFIINTPGYGDIVISHCVISNTNAGHLGTGIYLQGCLYVDVSHTDIIGWKNNINITPAASQEVTWSFFTSVLCDTAGEHGCTIISGGATQKVKGIYFTNCWFATSGTTGGGSGLGNGLNISSAAAGILDDIKVVGSRVIANQNHGINIALATNVNINSCSIWGNSNQTANTYDGITIAANTTNFSITDCLIGGPSTSPFANQQRYAVNVAAGTTNDYTITDNDVSGNTTGNSTGTINDASSTSGQGMRNVDRNVGHSVKGKLHHIVAASAALNTTETILLGGLNQAPIPRASLRVGDQFRFRLWGTCTATVGNNVTFRFRIGTAGTTADGAVWTAVLVSAAAGTTIPFEIEGVMTIRTLGAAATVHGTCRWHNQSVTSNATASTGITIFEGQVVIPTFATFDSTAANYIEVTHVTAATTTTDTFQGGYLEWL